ncbi:MAG: PTS mannose/fructose/sorbose transporter subunit IIB, partial [Chloroflexi bacterium]
MKELGLVRIDDRLIHGQVIAVWCKHRKFTRIVIVDDGVAADSFMVEVLGLAAPPDLRVDAFSVEDGVRALNEDTSNWDTTM